MRNVIPKPKKISFGEKRIPAACFAAECDPVFVPSLKVFEGYFDRAFGEEKGKGDGLILSFCPDLGEGYRISIGEKAHLFASDNTGMNHALATLFQLIEKTEEGVFFPCCEVEDMPDSSWRGFMVDTARVFHEIEYLYAAADLCWFYKMGRFQIHLTDDQGVRFPFDCLPEAVSEEHYTKEELQKLISYCSDRGIVIVPEVDAPGHFAAFNKAYPDLFGPLPESSGAETTVQTNQISGIMWGKEEAFDALKALFSETAEFFHSSPYIHIGGDEADISQWEKQEETGKFMALHGLKDVHHLYGYMVSEMSKMILDMGKIPVVWEGFSKDYNHMIPKETLVFAWESYYQVAPDLLEGGFQIINASWQPLYIVTPKPMWDPEVILDWEKNIWTHWWPKSFAHEKPIVVPPNDAILGGQLCAWGDKMYKTKYAPRPHMLKDEWERVCLRIAPLSEKLWNSYNTPDKEEFMKTLALQEERFEKMI